MLASLFAALLTLAFSVGGVASAKVTAETPSVLVIDAGLGDYELCSLHWLGEATDVVAENGGFVLTTSAEPTWWGEGGGEGKAPVTFMLACPESNRAVSPATIRWALDQIRLSGAEPRTFVVAMGVTGLPLREYAEDLSDVSQSSRADVVGIAFCGTPQLGLSAVAQYPESGIWDQIAATIGRTRDDLAAGSAYLQHLNGGSLPAICKCVLVNGVVGDLGFGQTDGACIIDDYQLPAGVCSQVDMIQVVASAGQACNLTGVWQPFVSPIDYPQRNVDQNMCERMSAQPGYETSVEVMQAVRVFFDAWYAKRAPVTFGANALLFDLSGSMLEEIEPGMDKLSSAKTAAKEYLRAIQAVSELPQAAPMSAQVIGFAEQTSDIASSYDRDACNAVDGLQAWGETNIGQVLDRAVAALENAPVCSDRHIVLLSDGASTEGMSNEEMLAGPVARAAQRGIVVDTIGFGDVGESNAGFLQQVSDATGGTYYKASDTYTLKVNFLKSYYSSLGLKLIDAEVDQGSPATIELGEVTKRTSAVQMSVVAQNGVPQLRILCDGEPLQEDEYVVQEEYGLLSAQIVAPRTGAYTLELSGDTGTMHVFSVQQEGIVFRKIIGEEQHDYALLIVAGVAAVLLACIGGVTISSKRRRRSDANRTASGGWDR